MQENDPPMDEDYNIPHQKKREGLKRKSYRKSHDPDDRHYSDKGGHFERGQHEKFKKKLARNKPADSPGR